MRGRPPPRSRTPSPRRSGLACPPSPGRERGCERRGSYSINIPIYSSRCHILCHQPAKWHKLCHGGPPRASTTSANGTGPTGSYRSSGAAGTTIPVEGPPSRFSAASHPDLSSGASGIDKRCASSNKVGPSPRRSAVKATIRSSCRPPSRTQATVRAARLSSLRWMPTLPSRSISLGPHCTAKSSFGGNASSRPRSSARESWTIRIPEPPPRRASASFAPAEINRPEAERSRSKNPALTANTRFASWSTSARFRLSTARIRSRERLRSTRATRHSWSTPVESVRRPVAVESPGFRAVNASAAPARVVLAVAATLGARCDAELALAELESLLEQLEESSKSPATNHLHIRFTRYHAIRSNDRNAVAELRIPDLRPVRRRDRSGEASGTRAAARVLTEQELGEGAPWRHPDG